MMSNVFVHAHLKGTSVSRVSTAMSFQKCGAGLNPGCLTTLTTRLTFSPGSLSSVLSCLPSLTLSLVLILKSESGATQWAAVITWREVTRLPPQKCRSPRWRLAMKGAELARTS